MIIKLAREEAIELLRVMQVSHMPIKKYNMLPVFEVSENNIRLLRLDGDNENGDPKD